MVKLSGLAKALAVGYLALKLVGCPQPPAPDTEAPTVPSSFTGTAQGDGEILYQWKESSDNVGVTEYQMKVSPYNISNPLSPIDASDISDVATMPVPVSSSTTLDKLIDGLDAAIAYTAYIRAGDAAGNWSDWEKVIDTISGSINPPSISFKPYGKIQNGTIPDGKTVNAKDKYNNIIDFKSALNGVTNGGWYGLEIMNRKSGMPVTIACQDYVPIGSTTMHGTERVDF
jgi:chitodextrinase